MNLGRAFIPRRPLGDVSVSNPYFGRYTNMNGTDIIDFNMNFIILLDKMFEDNNLDLLSEDQQKFINKFLYEAGKVTNALNKSDSNALSYLSETMKQLDSVLSQLKLPDGDN